MKKIPLTQGKFAIVDNDKYIELKKFSWCLSTSKKTSVLYAVRGTSKDGTIKMHRQILGDAAKNKCIDHINGDGLDNRVANLRICSSAQNLMNRGKNKNNTTGYKGVVYDKRGKKKYYAKIWKDRKPISLKYWDTPEEAALAYNDAAKKYHGEFAQLNVIRKESNDLGAPEDGTHREAG